MNARGICQDSYTKFFSFVLLYLCRLKFIFEHVKKNCPGEIVTGLDLSRVSLRRWGDFSIGEILLGGVFHSINSQEEKFSVEPPFY